MLVNVVLCVLGVLHDNKPVLVHYVVLIKRPDFIAALILFVELSELTFYI